MNCSFGGCANLRQTDRGGGLCRTHHDQHRAGLPMTVLPPRSPRGTNAGPCSFQPCGRQARTAGLCGGHDSQQRRGHKLYEIGDREAASAHRRAAWARLTPEERAARTAHLAEYGKLPKTAQHVQRMAESRKARWAERGGMRPTDRNCWGCGVTFVPTGLRQHYCTSVCWRITARARKYGMDRAAFDDLLAGQGGACALCASTQKGFNSGVGLHIDHCHETGRVRGLLCGDCNTALGRFGDNPALLRRAAEYLERE